MDRDLEYLGELPPGTQEEILDEIRVAESSTDSESEDEGPPATGPLSLPTPSQSSPPQSQQQNQMGKKIRWTGPLRDRFLHLCVQLRLTGDLGATNKTSKLEKALAEKVLPTLAREFPRDPFTIKNLSAKFRNTCTLFRKVKGLTRLSGVGYDDVSGRISTTAERWAQWHTINPGYRWVEVHGLPGMESIMEVIWPSELATGENISEVRDLRPRQQPAREAASSVEQSVPVSTNGAAERLPLSQATTVAGSAYPVAAQVPAVESNSRGRKRTSQQWDPDEVTVIDSTADVQVISENVVAVPPARRRRDSRIQAAESMGEAVRAIFASKQSQRPTGADDIQRAVDTCQTSLKPDLGSDGLADALNLFSHATTKAVAFNALREKDDKLMFLRSNGIGRINLGGKAFQA